MKINIVCDYLHLSQYQKKFSLAEKVVYLSPRPKKGNVNFDLAAFESALGCPLDPVSADLCEIAACVYLADKAIRRGEFDNWARNLSFLVPVREPTKWNLVRKHLTNTIATLTGDSVQFEFTKREEERGRGKYTLLNKSATPKLTQFDCVSLFSGGLDSFAGAVFLLQQRRRPLFISHYVNALLKNVQSNLIDDIRIRFGPAFEHLQYKVTSKRTAEEKFSFKANESSHRARSFLFLSFAAVAAAMRGVKDIYICENGVLALNVPLSEARQGSRSTRHAHPLYLKYFNRLITSLYEREFSILNPFLFWTKGKEAELLRSSGFSSAIKDTVSCWGYPNQTIHFKDCNHCGYCIPCIVRRVSVTASGMAPFDDRYFYDVFSADGKVKKAQSRNIDDLVLFCQSVASLSTNDLVYRYPEFFMIEADEDPFPSDKVAEIVKVYKNFAKEVLAAVKHNPS
jgi:7-cyano-7-deazaguanine synthase in queuosine biosynthesis